MVENFWHFLDIHVTFAASLGTLPTRKSDLTMLLVAGWSLGKIRTPLARKELPFENHFVS